VCCLKDTRSMAMIASNLVARLYQAACRLTGRRLHSFEYPLTGFSLFFLRLYTFPELFPKQFFCIVCIIRFPVSESLSEFLSLPRCSLRCAGTGCQNFQSRILVEIFAVFHPSLFLAHCPSPVCSSGYVLPRGDLSHPVSTFVAPLVP